MNILFITVGFAPYTFSESICNSKLVLAMIENGWSVDVISRIDQGRNYSTEWTEPWLRLKDITYHVEYPLGNKIVRWIDIARSAIKMGALVEGVRWAAHAYDLAYKLCCKKQYDVIITRSPSDIPHIVGYKLSRRTGIKWISNWNDPAATIWPEPYTHKFSACEFKRVRRYENLCLSNADAITYPAETLGAIFKNTYPFLSHKLCMEIPHIALVNSALKVKKYKKQAVFSLCHSGNLSVERNPENTFKAIRELIDEYNMRIKFDIMGYANKFTQELIVKYRLEHVVRFIGSYPYIEAMDRLQDYDALVLIEAMMDDGIFFPSKLVDYAQSGRPILAISPAKGFVSQVMNKYGGGLVVPNKEYKEIKKALKIFFDKWNNGSLCQDYATDALKNYFSPSSVIGKYIDLFQKLKVI